MNEQEKQPDIQHTMEDKDLLGEAWYAGLNSPLGGGSRTLCTMLLYYLGVGPRSRGVEYILSALEVPGDNHKKAMCLGEVMEYLANDPTDYYRQLLAKRSEFTSDHGFNHRRADLYEALGINQKGQIEVMAIMVEMSLGLLLSPGEGKLSAKKSGAVFEMVLNRYSNIDKKIIATAIYNFLTAPLSRPKLFGPPTELPKSSL